MTRRAVPLTFGFLAGLNAAYFLCVRGDAGASGFLFLVTIAALLGLIAMLFKLDLREKVMLFCAAFMLATVYSGLYTVLCLTPLEALSGETVTISGKITDMTYGDSGRVLIDGEVNGIRAKTLVYVNNFSGDIGQSVTLTARAERFADTPFFRARDYYLPDGVMLHAASAENVVLTDGHPSIIDRLRAYSRKVANSIRSAVLGGAGQFLAAMVTGERSAMSDALNLSLNRAGVGHLASVSGFHVSVVALAVYWLFKRAPRIIRFLLCETAVAAFVVFAGLRVSALRAAIMLTIALGAVIFRRKPDPLNTICLCALAMTIFSPYLVADTSFRLSLAGAFGVSVAAPNFIRTFGIKTRIAKALAVSLCACALTAPFIMQTFNELSIAAPLVNLFAVPMASLALVFGMIYAALGCRPGFLIRFAGALVSLVIRACEVISGIRAAYIPLGQNILPTLGIVALAVCVIVYIVRKNCRLTALCAIFCASMIIMTSGILTLYDRGTVRLTIINRASEHALLLRKGAECIIIDFEGRSAATVESIAERNGINAPRAAIIFGRAESGYSAYSSIPAKPEIIILPEDSYIFGGDIDTLNVPDGSTISLSWCGVTADSNGAHIVTENGEADISLGATEGDGIKISLLDGVTVIDDGTPEAYRGGVMKEIIIGGNRR